MQQSFHSSLYSDSFSFDEKKINTEKDLGNIINSSNINDNLLIISKSY